MQKCRNAEMIQKDTKSWMYEKTLDYTIMVKVQ